MVAAATAVVRAVWDDVRVDLVRELHAVDTVFDALARILLPDLDSPYRRALVAELLALRARVDPKPAWQPPPAVNYCTRPSSYS